MKGSPLEQPKWIKTLKTMVNNSYRIKKGIKTLISDMLIASVKVRIKLLKCIKN